MQLGVRETTLLIKIAVVVVVAVIVPAVLSGTADEYRQEEVNRQQSLRAELREVSGNRTDLAEQKRLYDSYLESYELWQERGVVTDTVDRTVWRNVMYDIKQRRDLGVIDFTFGEGRRVLPKDSVHTEESTASIEVLPMNISMPMLHSMDIFMFLGDLSKRAQGVFFPLSCEMTRLEPGFDAVLRNNLRGECEIVWVFVYDPEEDSI